MNVTSQDYRVRDKAKGQGRRLPQAATTLAHSTNTTTANVVDHKLWSGPWWIKK